MLQAIDNEGNRVILAFLSLLEIQFHKNHTSFFCPICKEKVVIKAGKRTIAHFAHFPNSSCVITNSGEGEYHERGKLELYQWLKSQRIPVQLEVYLPEIKQRPDLFIQLQTKKIAIEYQCAKISEQEFVKRNNGYARYNITPIWILGGKRMNRIGSNQLCLNPSDWLYVHQFAPNLPTSLYYYCPDAKQFSIFQHLYSNGRKKTFGSLNFFGTNNFTFVQLFQPLPFSENQLYIYWMKELISFRTNYYNRVSYLEKEWRQWLYAKGLHPSLLPPVFCLPNPYQHLIRVPPWVWQSILYFDILLNNPVVRLELCTRYLSKYQKTVRYPLMSSTPNPILHFLTLLTDLGYVKQHDNRSFSLIKEVELPRSIEQAMEQDNVIVKQLNC